MKRAPEYKGIEVQGMAQHRAGLPVRTGTRIQRTKSIGNCETSYARSAILIENKKRIRLAHESLDEKVNQLILGAL